MQPYKALILSMGFLLAESIINVHSTRRSINPLRLDKTEMKIQVGTKLKINCDHSNTSYQSLLKWLIPNKTSICELNSTRLRDVSGTLTIWRTELGDSGLYTCLLQDSKLVFNVTAKVSIYAEPDYFMMGMIVVGINAALLVVFIVCVVNRVTTEKKERRRRKPHRSISI